MIAEIQGLPRAVWLIVVTTLINRAGTMALPFLSLFLTRELGHSEAAAGFVLALFGVGSLVIAPVGGWLADRWGALVVMVASLILSGLLVVFYPFTRSYPALVALTLFWSVVTEVFRPASLAMVSQIVPPEQRRAAFAVFRVAINLGMSVGPALGGFLAHWSFPSLFWINGVATLTSGLLLGYFFYWGPDAAVPPRTEAIGPERESVLASFRGIAGDGRFLYFLLASLPVGMVFFQAETTLPLFLVRDLGLNESHYGLLFTINTLLILFLEVPLNMAMHQWPLRALLSVGAAFYAVGALFFAVPMWAPGGMVFGWIVTGEIISTFGEMIFFPAGSAFVAEISPPERRGGYMGFYSMGFSLSRVLGSWGGMALLSRGPQLLWVTSCLFGLVSVVCLAYKPQQRRVPCVS